MNKLFIFLLLIVLISCKKDVDITDTTTDLDQKINTAPKVFAGYNIKVTLPEDSVKLEATVTDAENNIAGYIWKKISGPVSYRFINENLLHLKVFDLQVGVYEFELTVTDKGALTGKDTVSVTVEPPINAAPKVSAGSYQIISLPVDHIILTGSATDAQNNIQSFQWRKISGPVSYQFENAKSAVTKLSGLERGIYEFELMVTDSDGFSGKDTVTISVIDRTKSGSNEIVFSNLPWDCLWACSMEVFNFNSFVPSGTPFKVYTKSKDNYVWIEAIDESQGAGNEKFLYAIYNNVLYVYTWDDENLSQWQVKIVF